MKTQTKEQLIEEIQDKVSNDEQFGNSICDISDTWRDAISNKLNKMKMKELKELLK